jgi:hypothetical protein
VGEPEEPPHRVHRGVDRGRHQPGLAEVTYVQLDVGALYPDQRVEAMGLAPAEPAAELVGVQTMGVAGVSGQVGNGRQLSRAHLVWPERHQRGVRHGWAPAAERHPHSRTAARVRRSLVVMHSSWRRALPAEGGDCRPQSVETGTCGGWIR